eukprot:scaffold736_cov254-Pinguiococcus_pyrenoidosus.AAC.3
MQRWVRVASLQLGDEVLLQIQDAFQNVPPAHSSLHKPMVRSPRVELRIGQEEILDVAHQERRSALKGQRVGLKHGGRQIGATGNQARVHRRAEELGKEQAEIANADMWMKELQNRYRADHVCASQAP